MSRRILIVNAYVDDSRRPQRRASTVLRSAAPPLLAAAFHRELCQIRLYDEHSSGPLLDRDLLGWPDLLVLTGMTAAYDRMRHLAAYARAFQPRVAVAAGGPAIRLLPRHSQQFFDYCCTGDVEQMAAVAEEALGRRYVDPDPSPRYDLAYWMRSVGHLESTRNCNFSCTFCSMTGEGRPYQTLDPGQLGRHIRACGRRRFLVLVDNNFYGNDHQHFLDRLEVLDRHRREGWFHGWGALVTSDFFATPENLQRARDAGCQALFCGIESFDASTLEQFHKSQNTLMPQVELIRRCLESGILLIYGMIADVTRRTVADLQAELAAVTRTPDIPLPSFVVLPIPFPGTPWFRECLERDLLLPSTRLRDLDGSTLCTRPLDPVPEVAAFVRDLQVLRGHRIRGLGHLGRFLWRYRRSLNLRQRAAVAARDLALMGLPSLLETGAAPLRWWPRRRQTTRTHVSSTEPLEPWYQPRWPVPSRLASSFEPTWITDEHGRLNPGLAEELIGLRPERHGAVGSAGGLAARIARP